MALAADPKKAVGMQAYMKSTMPYYGLNLLAVRRVSRQVFGDMEMGCLEWREKLPRPLRGARPPEKRYPATFFLTKKRLFEHATAALVPMLHRMVITRPGSGHLAA